MYQQAILYPILAMFSLTFVVWSYMYVLRISYLLRNNIDAQRMATPELVNATLPPEINNPANNLKNLFELPVIFYVLGIILLITQQVDEVFLYSAWAYFGFRALHSLVHCTFNTVIYRFITYSLSSLVLWFMVARLFYRLL